ncbi:MAG: NAD(P)/FAD-dependent oxidoreductase, partial [Roseimicrobium sp.]
MSFRSTDIAIIGSRIAANMAAAWFKQQHPDLKVTIIGRMEKQPPIVGESLTEYTAVFLRTIGMGDVLETKHMPKYGLTYYFKEKLEDPGDRRYAVHEAPRVPNIPTFLINRFTFDHDLVELNRTRGIEFIDRQVSDVELGTGGGRHTLRLKNGENEAAGEDTISARWVVDCSGRRRFLARKLGLHCDPLFQRSTFWFRLADFDVALLRNLEAVKAAQPPFDSYTATHHFLGKGNWIWCIPLRSEQHRTFISIGITYRPEMLASITSMEEFLRHVDTEHPVVGDLVRSGTVVDTNSYGSYMYEASQLYSEDRWFL